MKTTGSEIVRGERISLSTFSTDTKTLNALVVVATYTLMGIADLDIAFAMGIGVDQVLRARTHEAYAQVQDRMIGALFESRQADIRTRIQLATDKAVNVIETLMEDAEDENVKLRAARDVLDRGGHRPADVVDVRHSMEGGLRIRVIHEDKQASFTDLPMEIADAS